MTMGEERENDASGTRMNLPDKIANDMPLLELRHVSLRLDGRPALRDVELALLSGEIHVGGLLR